MIKITRQDFSVDTVLRSLKTRETGAIVTFLGIVRGKTEGRTVEHIEVQSYEEMAKKQLATIRKEALSYASPQKKGFIFSNKSCRPRAKLIK